MFMTFIFRSQVAEQEEKVDRREVRRVNFGENHSTGSTTPQLSPAVEPSTNLLCII